MSEVVVDNQLAGHIESLLQVPAGPVLDNMVLDKLLAACRNAGKSVRGIRFVRTFAHCGLSDALHALEACNGNALAAAEHALNQHLAISDSVLEEDSDHRVDNWALDRITEDGVPRYSLHLQDALEMETFLEALALATAYVDTLEAVLQFIKQAEGGNKVTKFDLIRASAYHRMVAAILTLRLAE